MKFAKIIACMLCMWAITALGQTKVTFPTPGANLYRDEVVAIKWDRTAFQGNTVTIVVATAYDYPKSVIVGRNITNDGQQNWKVTKGDLPNSDSEFELRIYGSESGMAVVVVNILPPRANPAPDADAEPVVTPPTPTPVTRPTNSLETVSIGTVVKVGWSSKTNCFYQVEKSTDGLTSWKKIEIVIGSGEPMERTFETEGGNSFFRVVKLGSVPDMTSLSTIGVNLVDANLTNSVFRKSVMTGGTMERAILDKSDFGEAEVWWVNLHATSMKVVQMVGATFAFCDFTDSNLEGINGTNCTFLMCNFTGAKMAGATLDNCKFYNCIMPDGTARNDPLD
jgi:hypothetical protein